MGFANNAYATVWDVRPSSETVTSARITITRRDKETNEYIQEFGEWVNFKGTLVAKRASELKPKDRIKLLRVDARSSKYDPSNPDQPKRYYWTVWDYEMADGSTPATPTSEPKPTAQTSQVEEDDEDEGELPF